MRIHEASLEETTELCGEAWDPKDPTSPLCLVPKHDHAGREHQAFMGDGRTLKWPVERNPIAWRQ